MCRNQERGEAAKQEISSESSNEVSPFHPFSHSPLTSSRFFWQKIHLHLLDLSKPKDVTKFTRDFIQSGQQLDVLVSNIFNICDLSSDPVICHVTSSDVILCHVTPSVGCHAT